MSYTELYFHPSEAESVYAAARLREEQHSAISLKVLSEAGEPSPNCLALLFDDRDELIASACTDDAGYVAFGPLRPMLYKVRLYKDGLRLREIEIRS